MRLASKSIWTHLACSGLGYQRSYGKLDPTIKRLSHPSIATSEGRVPSRPMPPVVYGESSGTQALPSSGLMIGPASTSATFSSSSVAPRAPEPARIAVFLAPLSSAAADSSVSRWGTTIGGRHEIDV